MNIDYLMRYISCHLHTLIRKFGKDSRILEEFCGRPEFKDRTVCTPDVAQQLLTMCTPEIPAIVSLNSEIIYASVETPDEIFLIGPVKFFSPVYLKLNVDIPPIPKKWLMSVSGCDFSVFLKDVLLCCNLFRSIPCTAQETISLNCIREQSTEELRRQFSSLYFPQEVPAPSESPFDRELREFENTENGDVQKLKYLWTKSCLYSSGTLAKNKLRSSKNIGIMTVALASRAAIRGGVVPEIACSLSDIYIQKIEEESEEENICRLTYKCELHYAYMVRELKDYQEGRIKTRKSPLIHQCKDYIFSHLHDKLCIRDIAKELGMNANYLSECFKQHEGISMKNFILKEKIRLAKNLLIYSQYSYLEIADSLSFSSQSHLGKEFKKETGFTLRHYREMYRKKEYCSKDLPLE